MKRTVSLNELVYLLREGGGLTQTDFAKAINKKGIDHSVISRFERENTELPEDVLLKMAGVLHLSRDYVLQKSDYPFIKKHYYKLYTAGRSNNKLDLLNILPLVCQSFDCVAIVPELSAFTKYFRMRNVKYSLYAIAIKDNEGTIFLLRDPNPRAFLRASEYLFMELSPVLKQLLPEESSQFQFFIEHTGTELSPTYDIFEKIKDWTVKREDVSLLFGEKTGEAMYLSIAEKSLIMKMRKNKVNIAAVDKSVEGLSKK